MLKNRSLIVQFAKKVSTKLHGDCEFRDLTSKIQVCNFFLSYVEEALPSSREKKKKQKKNRCPATSVYLP